MLAERVLEWTEQWKQQGLREGRREGLREGRREGRREGVREGRREGRQQGQLEEARALLVEAIRGRFGRVPRDVATALRRIESRETLHALLRQLIAGATLEAMREALHAEPPSPGATAGK